MTNPPSAPHFDITPVTIEEEMKRSYLDYAMSVIVSRALPDVRDGLKPVHRRILYAMKENGYDYNKAFRKSARIVGDVMGKYHPHGDAAIYDAMVRMAQEFSMRLPLIDGQGNFGSMDGDPPAAMRYTEARLARAAHTLIEDIDKETVDFQPNYDDSSVEPMVLPARFPNLLINGAGGIAVGMATNIPPHNLGEVIDACCAAIDDPDITPERLMELVPGPDFPTGGVILGRAGIRAAFLTGRGSVVMRARVHVEEIRKDRDAIIVTEVPYQINKARMLEQIAELVRDKKIEGVSELRDESDRDGVRVVIELKRDAIADVVLNQLYRFTPLQTSFGVNTLALNGGRPQMMTLKDIIAAFLAFREEVITRRTIFELGRARDRAHVLAGLAIAVANIDEVIALIRSAPDAATARERLMAQAWPVGDVEPLIRLIDEPGREIVDGRYALSETQAKAILDLRLHRLTGLERGKIGEELSELGAQIREYLEILSSRPKLLEVMRQELLEIREQFATPRRTTIEENEFEADIEDLIAREDMVVTVTNTGYIKRVPLSTYRAQKRGGKGRSGMAIKEEDFLSQVFVANTHTPVLFFSSTGLAYKMKVYRLPLGTPQARGKAMVNLLPIAGGETISTIMPLPEDEGTWGDLHVMFATSKGDVRRNLLSDFVDIRANGKIAMKLGEGERLIAVQTCSETDDVLLATRQGKAIRFPVPDVRVFKGRDSTGVRGIRLEAGDEVIGMSILRHVEFDSETRDAFLRGELAGPEAERMEAGHQFILTMTANGFGKRTSAYEYRVTGRGGQGIANIEMTGRNGPVVASFPIGHDDEIMLVSDGGTLIRMPVHDIRIAGRKTQGVTLLRTAEGEQVVSAARLCDLNGSGEEGDEGEGEDTGDTILPGGENA
ncbi:MAG: DNA gyrase subunit A [Magnetospirillum sp.]|nr:DNA gyrase subunit A [Magnetospirillum sp.]